MTVRGTMPDGDVVSVSGTLVGPRRIEKLVEVDGFDVDLLPTEHMAFFRYHDRPGVVGAVGQLLGDTGINIAGMQVSRDERGGHALMALTVDSAVPHADAGRHRAGDRGPTPAGPSTWKAERMPETPAARTLRLAVIGGDGIGPEVVAEGLKVLAAVAPGHGLTVETTDYDLGAAPLARDGRDAARLGARGAARARRDPARRGRRPVVPSGVLERGLLLRLRFELDHHVNLRPVRCYPGVTTPLAGVKPGDIDMVVVREGTEGPYAGSGGFLRKGTPARGRDRGEPQHQRSASSGSYATRSRARLPGRGKLLTLVHKNNVLVHAGDLWTRTVAAVAADFPDVAADYVPRRRRVRCSSSPSRSASTSSSPTTCSATSSPTSVPRSPAASASRRAATSTSAGTNPSMFEPVHGSAPDIAGQGIADPTATVLSVAMLLDHLGCTTTAARGRRRRGGRPGRRSAGGSALRRRASATHSRAESPAEHRADDRSAPGRREVPSAMT